ncbi:Predicted membrane protein [Chlamydia trachomatis]|nr:Predicted membrane protein [Chlamydia trachomatis]
MRFSHWTSDQAKQNEDHNVQGVFDFGKRHIFTEDTVISPVTQPAEPDKPVEPDKPSEPEKPAEPDKPSEPEKPSEPSTPAEPEKPAEPMQPQVAQTPTLSHTGGNLVFAVFGSFLLLTIGAVLVKKKGSRSRKA